MSRSKLSNTELKFYNTASGSDVIHAKLQSTSANTLVLSGATAGTKLAVKNMADPTESGDAATYNWVNSQIAAGETLAGAGLDKTNNTLSVDADGATLETNSNGEVQVKDAGITTAKLADASVTEAKLASLTSLTIAGNITAEGFIATGDTSTTEDGSGFGVCKAKSLNIQFNADQTISADGNFHVIGGSSDLASVQFDYDDAITLAVVLFTIPMNHSGTTSNDVALRFEVSFYNSSGVAQAYTDIYGQDATISMSHSSAQDVLFPGNMLLGNGNDRMAKLRLKVSHQQSSNTLKITGKSQVSAVCIDDNSGHTTRTYTSTGIQ